MSWPSALGEGLEQGFNALGEGLMWGGAAGNPQVMQGMLQMMMQKRSQDAQRRQFLGDSIIQSVQAGEVPWEEARAALQKLGYPVQNMQNPFGTPGVATGNFYNQLDQFYQGGGGANATATATANAAPGGLQPSPLAPPVQTQPFAPTPTPSGQAIDETGAPTIEKGVLLSERKDQSGNMVRTYRDPQGRQYTVSADPSGKLDLKGGMDDTIIEAMTPDERASYEGSSKILAAPRLTQSDLVRMLNQSGVRSPREREKIMSHFQGLLKEDLERRNNAIEQQKLAIETSQKRLQEPKTITVEEADPKNPEKVDKVTYRFDPQHKRPGRRNPEDPDYVQIARAPRQPPMSVTQSVSPGVREEETLSAKQVIEKDQASLEGNQQLKSQIETARNMNDNIIGGSWAETRTGVATMLSTAGLLSQEQEERLANTSSYQKLLNQFMIGYINQKLFPQRVTNVDLQFLAKLIPEIGSSAQARKQILDMLDYYNDQHSKVVESRIQYYMEKHGRDEAGRRYGTVVGFTPPPIRPFATLGAKDLEKPEETRQQRMQYNDLNK